MVGNKIIKQLWHSANLTYLLPNKSDMLRGEDVFLFHEGCDYAVIFIDHKKSDITVAFRGTRGIIAWKENFDAIDRQEFEKHQARVHEGFWEGFTSLEGYLVPLIELYHAKGYSVYITGHSRGGAIATITAWRLWESYGIKSICVSFAAPRQGGKRYAASVEDSPIDFLRVQTKFDIVPNVPPRILGYTHVDPYLILETTPFPYNLRLLRGILQHTQGVYERAIYRLAA